MKVEKILACVLAGLLLLCVIVYLTLPEQGEQIYIPPVQSTPEEVDIPDGYKPVENFNDVYYVETEDGIRYFWLMKFENGTYGWQEVDKDGNVIFPNRETESTTETVPTTETEPTESTDTSETSEETTVPSELSAESSESTE